MNSPFSAVLLGVRSVCSLVLGCDDGSRHRRARRIRYEASDAASRFLSNPVMQCRQEHSAKHERVRSPCEFQAD